MTEATGRRLPLDPELRPEGNVIIVDRMPDGHETPVVRVLKQRELPVDGGGYVSHFATCPNAAQHRRR